MKKSTLIKFAPIVLTISLILTSVQLVQAEIIQIERDFQPDPLILNGESGGTEKSNCGNISAQPNRVIQVAESFPYLRLTVESTGKPTLLIDGPEGRFCVLADSYSQDKPEISGYWQAGEYSLYIGELTKQQHTYTLSISQQKMPQK
ncbi:hypothetical protein [Rivularia sp. UHCC 0363]|uniref:hypothetical protein n=1 Tax=Rivularia sp. UHCC 0363 TaxID=3110244 RepID=UPI002B1F580C|nr:hypothetical protein [Rivularia sp. UHCC 0363]MEA5594542.1 hypothetical protein [Rivularia sp. UHCC 0363]